MFPHWTDIENVKGKEKFTREDDGSLSWNAKGNDIYYEGKTDQEAPVSMDIKYYLDDKEVDGADLFRQDRQGEESSSTIRTIHP